jgi:hypothetical protein
VRTGIYSNIQWNAFQHLVRQGAIASHKKIYSIEARSHHFDYAKFHMFDMSSWEKFCDVTLTLKQASQSDNGVWIKIDDYPCRRAFRHFMNLLNRAVFGAAFRRYGKRLRVLPVLEKGKDRARALRLWERGTSGGVARPLCANCHHISTLLRLNDSSTYVGQK